MEIASAAEKQEEEEEFLGTTFTHILDVHVQVIMH
jgi:hypothetical protein